MTNRSLLVKDIFQNGKQGTWDDYAIKYDIKDAKTANDYWRFFVKNGSIEGLWEPSFKEEIIQESEENLEELNYLTPKSELIESRIFQEFMAWKESKEKERTFTPGTFALMGCTHVPFHHREFFSSCLNLFSDIKPTGLLLCGDFMDMNSVSGHEIGKRPIEGVTLAYEYEEGNKALDLLDSCNDWKIKHYLYGNHEDFFWRHVKKSEESKYGSALINPTVGLNLKKRNYQVQEDWKKAVVYLGKHLEVVHGENCSQFATQKMMNIFRTSIAFFHIHRVQCYMEGNTAGWSLGWGGDINQQAFNYATKAMKASWKNCIGIVTIDEDGGYHMTPIIYHNNRFYYGGKRY